MVRKISPIWYLLLGWIFLLVFSQDVGAAGDQYEYLEKPIEIELNKVEQAGSSCRTFLLIDNKTEKSFDELRLDLALFDKFDLVISTNRVELGLIRSRKLTLRVFDFENTECSVVAAVLLNDVKNCGFPRDRTCVELFRPRSSSQIRFFW